MPQDAYTASKGALISLTKSLAVQYARHGIRANIIHPGIVETPMQAPYLADPGKRASFEGATPLGRLARPEEIAQVALFLASEESSYVTGAEIPVDGGYTATGDSCEGDRGTLREVRGVPCLGSGGRQARASSHAVLISRPSPGASVGRTRPFRIGTVPGNSDISSRGTPGGETPSDRSPIGIAGMASDRC